MEVWNRDDVPPIQYNSPSKRLRRFGINLAIICVGTSLVMVAFAVLVVGR